MNTYNDLQLSYIAGIVDGEGCFCVCISRHSKEKVYYCPRLVIEMTDFELLSFISSRLGIGKLGNSRKRGNNRRTYTYGIYDFSELYQACCLLLPYLISKKKQAEFIKSFYEMRIPGISSSEDGKNLYDGICKLNHPD